MIYENARRLLKAATDNGIVKTVTEGMKGQNPKTGELSDLPVGDLILYKSAGNNPDEYPEGWYHQPFEEVVHELMDDQHGIEIIAKELIEINQLPELIDESQFENGDQDFVEHLMLMQTTPTTEQGDNL